METISSWVFALGGKNALLDGVIIFLAKFLPYLLVTGFFLFIIRHKDWKTRWLIFAEGALAVILSRGIITETFRFFYLSPRPFEVLNIQPLFTVQSQSFPSGHASLFFALATSIFYFSRRLGWWYVAFASVNGFARIFAGVHWPSDIIGGAAVGILSSMLVKGLLKAHSEKVLQEKPTTIDPVRD